MDELKVPKRQVAAEVLLPGGRARRMTLFLAEGAPDHQGPEVPLDLLNGRHDFLPARDEATGAMTFLHRPGVAAVRVDRALDAAEEEVTLPTEHEVEVRLADGTGLTGLVTYEAPVPHDRLVDFLNRPEPFFRLLERDGVALVGRAHVARVSLLPR